MKRTLIAACAAALLALPIAMPAQAGHVATMKKGSHVVEIHSSRSNSNMHWVKSRGSKRKAKGTPQSAIRKYKSRGYKQQ